MKAPELAPRPPLAWGMHTVVQGDTLWELADQYMSDPFRYPDLARWSLVKNPNLIYPGETILYQSQKPPTR